jgi:hypothetical protein
VRGQRHRGPTLEEGPQGYCLEALRWLTGSGLYLGRLCKLVLTEVLASHGQVANALEDQG